MCFRIKIEKISWTLHAFHQMTMTNNHEIGPSTNIRLKAAQWRPVESHNHISRINT